MPATSAGMTAEGTSPVMTKKEREPMRHKLERDPLQAARERLEAVENASFLAHLEECSEIAVMLAHENDKRLGEAIARGGRAAIEAEWRRCKTRIPFAQFFATEALAHTKCSRKPCRRAKRCANSGLSCLRGYSLFREEDIRARLAFDRFIRIMTAPESESDQAVTGRG
jgi:hypothetical protein